MMAFAIFWFMLRGSEVIIREVVDSESRWHHSGGHRRDMRLKDEIFKSLVDGLIWKVETNGKHIIVRNRCLRNNLCEMGKSRNQSPPISKFGLHISFSGLRSVAFFAQARRTNAKMSQNCEKCFCNYVKSAFYVKFHFTNWPHSNNFMP